MASRDQGCPSPWLLPQAELSRGGGGGGVYRRFLLFCFFLFSPSPLPSFVFMCFAPFNNVQSKCPGKRVEALWLGVPCHCPEIFTCTVKVSTQPSHLSPCHLSRCLPPATLPSSSARGHTGPPNPFPAPWYFQERPPPQSVGSGRAGVPHLRRQGGRPPTPHSQPRALSPRLPCPRELTIGVLPRPV